MRARISLRMGVRYYAVKERRNEMLALLKEYRDTIDEVAFFTGGGFFPPHLSLVEQQTGQLREAVPQFKALGLSVGFNQHTTLMALYEKPGQSLSEPWQRMQFLDGKTCLSYCAADVRMQAYVRQLYVLLAQAGPDFIWIDDDVHLEPRTCFCDFCMADFARESGKSWTREALADALNGGSLTERLAARKQWLAHNRLYFAKLYALIRDAVDSVNPAIHLGCMNGDRPYDGCGYEEITAALAGRNRLPVKWRPGAGFYSDERPVDVLDKAHTLGRIAALLPELVAEIQSENEHFPCQSQQKSTTLVAVEVGAYMAAGCTGCALNFLLSGGPIDEDRSKFARVKLHRKFYDRLAGTFGRSPCEGLWRAQQQDRFASQFPDGNWFEQGYRNDEADIGELAQIGLPVAYGRKGASLTLLAGNTCLDFTRAELVELLSGGVLLDGWALTRLNEMGLGEYTGFTVHGTKREDASEVLTADPLNGPFAGWRRDYFPSWWRTQTTHLLAPATPQSRVLAEDFDLNLLCADPSTKAKNFGATSGIFENRLGGRVAVLGCYPWHMLLSLAKSSQLKALMRWLSKEQLPAYVGSFHKVVLWCRRDVQGNPALFLVNTSQDVAEGIQVMTRNAGDVLTLLRSDGTTQEALRRVDEDGPYGRFGISRLMPWEMVMVTQTN